MSKGERIAIILIGIAFISSLVYGYFLFTQPENCWDKYPTENQAIEMCEGN